jgi:hypothetical protein
MKSILMAATILLAGSLCLAQPVQWAEADGGNGHWYEVVDCPECTWIVANELAQDMVYLERRGHLVTLTSAEENDWVWLQFSEPCSYWIGGYQLEGSAEPGGGWVWVTGEDWVFENWSSQGQQEPNDSFNGVPEGYLQLDWNCWPTWNDFPNFPPSPGFVGGYIVEFDEFGPVSTVAATWGSVKALYR